MTDQPFRLMAVLAHPDDESLGCGGTLARYAGEGVETFVVTATRGQSGRYRGERFGSGTLHPGPDELGRIREAELRAACRVLGVRGVRVLDYLDGALDRADPREVIATIASELRRVRPQVVITFAPDGSYGHPDHIAISQLTTAALIRAAAPGPGGEEPHLVSKLYYMAWTDSVWAAYQEAFRQLRVTVDGVERQAAPWLDWAVTTALDTRAVWATVWEAVSCHESQVSAYEGLRNLSPESHEALWGVQQYYRAASLVNGGREIETDLFEGLRGLA